MDPVPPPLPLRILLMEDSPLDAELITAELQRAGFPFDLRRVSTEAGLRQELESPTDLVLCDFNLPGFGGGEALELVRARDPDMPFIIVSGSIGEETAVELIKRGADDYLLKDRLGRLGPAITNAIEDHQHRSAARRAEEDLRFSEHKYRTVFECVPEASYLCDARSGRIIDTNRRGETILGLSRSAILGQRLGAFLPESVSRHLLSLAGSSSEPIEVDTEITASGRIVPVHVNATNLVIANRKLLLAFLR